MMGIDHKIEEAKNYFNKMQKSGRNNYQKFDYFEVKDIFPVVREVCKKFKMRSKFDWDPKNDIMTLTIKDLEDGSIDVSTIPVASINAGDAGKHMQDIGRCQTYAQRYLYIQVFEIAVPDDIDNHDQKKMGNKKVPQPNTNNSNTQKKTQYSPVPVKESQNDDEEVTAEHIHGILSKAEKQFHEAQLKKLEKDRLPWTWNNAKDIIRSLCRNDEEYKICQQSTIFKTADKVK